MKLVIKSEGPGRGWWGPPKGTHTAANAPGGKDVEEPGYGYGRKKRGVKRKKPPEKAKPKPEPKSEKPRYGSGEHPLTATQEGEERIRITEAIIATATSGETGALYTPDGTQLFSKANPYGSFIEFTDDEIAAIKKSAAQGPVIFTHSHPSGHSFSPEDMVCATSWNVAEMRAVGRMPLTTETFLYRMSRPKGGWGSFGKFNAVYDEAEKRVTNKMWGKINTGKITPALAGYWHHHEIWLDVSRQMGWDYSREQVD